MIIICILPFALAACGGGGGSDPAPAPDRNPGSGGGGSPGPTEPPPEFFSFSTEHLDRINLPDMSAASSDESDGSPVAGPGTIAVIDTGFLLTHVGIADRIIEEIDTQPELDVNPGLRDHGTMVSTLAAGTNVGVSPDATLLLVDAGEGGALPDALDMNEIAEGLEMLAGRDVSVLSLSVSLNPSNNNRVFDALVSGIQNDDWVVVYAAGNDNTADRERGVNRLGSDSDRSEFEGQVLVVGSVDANNQISGFSNRAFRDPSPDTVISHYLVAPGEIICGGVDEANQASPPYASCGEPSAAQVQANNGDPRDDSDAAYNRSQGTSFAQPLVAGAVSLIRTRYPELDGVDVVNMIISSAQDLGEPGYDRVYGAGLLDVAAALDAADEFVANMTMAPVTTTASAPSVKTAAYSMTQSHEPSEAPENAVKIRENLYMAPSGRTEEGCFEYTAWSDTLSTNSMIHYRTARGEFVTVRDECLPEATF